MTADELAGRIEHTLLRPDATEADVVRLCAEAIAHKFYGVCVNPYWVGAVREALSSFAGAADYCRIVGVVGFPFGATPVSIKTAEARRVMADDADEIDLVMNVGAFRSGEDGSVAHEIATVVRAVDGAPVKVILECCYLTEVEIVRAAGIAMDEGAAFVKTSTGFAPRGATVEDVRLLRRAVGGRVGVKAAGGIRDLWTAVWMLQAGADRLGCSSSVKIMQEAVSVDGTRFLHDETLRTSF